MEKMQLIPIKERLEENEEFTNNLLYRQILRMTIDFYKKVGFVRPWIGYYAQENDVLVGSGGFKGQPVNGTVEIAYGTFEKYRNQGIGTAICGLLVGLSLEADPAVRITARTLQEENFSTRILQKNNIKLPTSNLQPPTFPPTFAKIFKWNQKSRPIALRS